MLSLFTFIMNSIGLRSHLSGRLDGGTVDNIPRMSSTVELTYQPIYSVSKYENKISPLLGGENQHQGRALLTSDKCSDIITKTHQIFISTLFY